jgi:hypothetical protein
LLLGVVAGFACKVKAAKVTAGAAWKGTMAKVTVFDADAAARASKIRMFFQPPVRSG